MKFLFTALTCTLLLSQTALAAKTVKVPKEDLISEAMIDIKDYQPGERFEKDIERKIELSETCRGEVTLHPNDAPGETYGAFYDVQIKATCLNAALFLFNQLQLNPRFEVNLMLPVPAMIGSNK